MWLCQMIKKGNELGYFSTPRMVLTSDEFLEELAFPIWKGFVESRIQAKWLWFENIRMTVLELNHVSNFWAASKKPIRLAKGQLLGQFWLLRIEVCSKSDFSILDIQLRFSYIFNLKNRSHIVFNPFFMKA